MDIYLSPSLNRKYSEYPPIFPTSDEEKSNDVWGALVSCFVQTESEQNIFRKRYANYLKGFDLPTNEKDADTETQSSNESGDE